MSESLKNFIGVALLILSVGVTSCQALVSSETTPAIGTAAPPLERAGD